MTKKNFKAQGAAAISFITQPPAHDTHTAHRKPEKRAKLQRINMAYRPANIEHLQIMARIAGVSITEYNNRIIEVDAKAKADIVSKFKKMLK